MKLHPLEKIQVPVHDKIKTLGTRPHSGNLPSAGSGLAANLTGAYLERPDLEGATLTGAIMPHGETWEQYLSEVVPALLVAGATCGRTQ